MEATQYFANLRQIQKLKMIIEEYRIKILEIKRNSYKDIELQELFIHQAEIEKAIQEYNLKNLLKLTNEMKVSEDYPPVS